MKISLPLYYSQPEPIYRYLFHLYASKNMLTLLSELPLPFLKLCSRTISLASPPENRTKQKMISKPRNILLCSQWLPISLELRAEFLIWPFNLVECFILCPLCSPPSLFPRRILASSRCLSLEWSSSASWKCHFHMLRPFTSSVITVCNGILYAPLQSLTPIMGWNYTAPDSIKVVFSLEIHSWPLWLYYLYYYKFS